jgi:homoserine O-acetyltransferase
MRKLHAFLIVFSLITVVSFGQGYQTPVEGDYVIEDFQFESGESLPKLNLHYRTIGKPTKGLTGKLITQY